MKLVRLFAEHPASVGESYWQHFRVAACFGVSMIGGGLASLVHAAFPFAFVTRGSETIGRLHERLLMVRSARGAAAQPPVSELDATHP